MSKNVEHVERISVIDWANANHRGRIELMAGFIADCEAKSMTVATGAEYQAAFAAYQQRPIR